MRNQEAAFVAAQKAVNLDENDKRSMQELRVVDPRAHVVDIMRRKDKPLEGSYKWILTTDEYERFSDWSTSNSPKVLWISGSAGTGKTMLMLGIIQELSGTQSAPQINAATSFSFIIGSDKTFCTAVTVLRNLIWLLLDSQPQLMPHLRTRYRNQGKNLFEDVYASYSLSQVLSAMLKDEHLRPVVLMVDALDECNEGETGLGVILDLIETSMRDCPNVKWIVTSRPRRDIKQKLDVEKHPGLVILDLDSMDLEQPVNYFIDYKIGQLRQNEGYDTNETLVNKVANRLRNEAGKTFLWVALVCKELEDAEDYEADDVLHKMPLDLYELYQHILDRIDKAKVKRSEYCRRVLGVAVFSYEPVTLSEMAVLAGFEQLPDRTVDRVVADCGSFLVVRDNTIFLVHGSAKEFFMQALTELNFDDQKAGHLEVARRALNGMDKGLKRNILGLESPGATRDELEDTSAGWPGPLLSSLRYPCVHCIEHLCDSYDARAGFSHNDMGTVLGFMKSHFLHWLEALGLLDQISAGILSLIRLNQALKNSTAPTQQDTGNELSILCQDAFRFMFFHRQTIEIAPLQTYASALLFSPTDSMTRKIYQHEAPAWVNLPLGTNRQWDPWLLVLENKHSPENVSFSTDGRLLAASFADGPDMVRVFVANTGEFLHAIPRQAAPHDGKEPQVRKVVGFLPNDKLAAQLDEQTLGLWSRTWDLEKRYKTRSPIAAMAVAPDGRIGLGLANGNVHIWSEWDDTRSINITSSLPIVSVVFAADGRVGVLASRDGPVPPSLAPGSVPQERPRIWTWPKGEGKPEQLKISDNFRASTIAFSTEDHGSILALGSSGGHIGLIDLSQVEAKLFQRLEIQSGSPLEKAIVNVAFRSGSSFPCLVSLSLDTTLIVWNYRTKEKVQRFQQRIFVTPPRLQMASNGMMATFASWAEPIQVWDLDLTMPTNDPQQDQIQGAFAGYSNFIFATDASFLACVTNNWVFLFDTATGTVRKRIENKGDMAYRLAISSDNGLIIWPSTTSQFVKPCESLAVCDLQHDRVQEVNLKQSVDGDILAFSPRKLYCSLATAEPIRQGRSSWKQGSGLGVWDLSAGEPRSVYFTKSVPGFRADDTSIVAIAISPDADVVAYIMFSEKRNVHTAWILNVKSGQHQQLGDAAPPPSSALAFSPDNLHLAVPTASKSIDIWVTHTGSLHARVPVAVQPRRLLEYDVQHPNDRLLTNFGAISLGEGNALGSFLPDSYVYGDGDDLDWLKWNGRKVLYIPQRYRPTSIYSAQMRGEYLVFTLHLQRPLLFKFSPDTKPLYHKGDWDGQGQNDGDASKQVRPGGPVSDT
ncbi:hypothetical protein BJ170DRAFT_687517 [Xylariales sp. AK1849]|nr:hypothetical protein BJ170DRAFT_687517 [Xylariales sp. AK1849]